MEQVERKRQIEQKIEQARQDRVSNLDLSFCGLTALPESIGTISTLTELNLTNNRLNNLPRSIVNLSKLTKITLTDNCLNKLPDEIGKLHNLVELHLYGNQLTSLPDCIGNLSKLTRLSLCSNRLTDLTSAIGSLVNLSWLNLYDNRLTSLPKSIKNLSALTALHLSRNPLTDLSSINALPNLKTVSFFGVELSPRYWTRFSDWQPEWLLDEDNAEIRRVLIDRVGYEKICEELKTVTIDTWREFTLLKIDGAKKFYDPDGEPIFSERYTIDSESIVLLKMICPSTAHIHILRVPPKIVSAEAAITWVHHGIHPDEFTVQT
jgi:leucine-rich repeat protein SHOC2